jgi:hypothetical protein
VHAVPAPQLRNTSPSEVQVTKPVPKHAIAPIDEGGHEPTIPPGTGVVLLPSKRVGEADATASKDARRTKTVRILDFGVFGIGVWAFGGVRFSGEYQTLVKECLSFGAFIPFFF